MMKQIRVKALRMCFINGKKRDKRKTCVVNKTQGVKNLLRENFLEELPKKE